MAETAEARNKTEGSKGSPWAPVQSTNTAGTAGTESSQDSDLQVKQVYTLSFSLPHLLLVGLVGIAAGAVATLAVGAAFRHFLDLDDNMGANLVVYAPLGYSATVGKYLEKISKTGSLRAQNVIIALGIAALIGLVAGLLGQQFAHPNARDSWPVISTLMVPVVTAIMAFWPIK